MKKLFITLASLAIAGAAFAQTASFTITDNGLYGGTNTTGTFNSTDTFTLSLYGTFSGLPPGFSTTGFSLYLESPTASGFNTDIQASTATYFQFTADNTTSGYPQPFNKSLGSPDAGNMTTEDVGATTANSSQRAGNFSNLHLADYTFNLTNAPAGTYVLRSTSASEISYDDNSTFTFALAPQISYSVNVAAVPEPSTYFFAGFGAAGVIGYSILRRRRAA